VSIVHQWFVTLEWLRHADARQVSDLPKAHSAMLTVSDRFDAVRDREIQKGPAGKS
jgi:hypothetical protein